MATLHTKKTQEGMAILISVLLVGVMLSIVFALSAIFIPKIRASAETKNSVPAVYAAESALEWCLYVSNKSPVPSPSMAPGITFTVAPIDCSSFPIKATGAYRGVPRVFQIN